MGWIRTVFTVGTAIGKGLSHVVSSGRDDALKTMRKANGDCNHILIDSSGGFGDRTFCDLSGEQTVKLERGVIFRGLDYTFFHPNSRFAPNHQVEWLVRSTWHAGGADPQHNNFPAVPAMGGLSPEGKKYWWRQISNDHGGGDPVLGHCDLCDAANLE